MLHRLLAISIVGFWLAMMSLLVVREMYPESTGLNAVALSYVGQVFFQHQQTSDLQIYSGAEEIGFVHVQPRASSQPDQRELDIHGSLNVPLPNGQHHRLSWLASFQLTSRFTMERFHVDLTTRENAQHLDIAVDCFAGTADIAIKNGKSIISKTTVTLDEKGFAGLMSEAGLDPALLQQVKSAGTEMPRLEFAAQVSSVILSGEKVATYLLTMKAGGQPVIEAHLSQLGQVLSARAPLMGYKLVPPKDAR